MTEQKHRPLTQPDRRLPAKAGVRVAEPPDHSAESAEGEENDGPNGALERLDGVIRYVESWADVVEGDPFLDDLRFVRAALAAPAEPKP